MITAPSLPVRSKHPMAWAILEHSKKAVNRAGRALVTTQHGDPARDAAIGVINNWRSCHGYPLHAITMTLRTRAPRIDSNAVVVQRLKRLASIDAKLRLFDSLTLSQMQDIGGSRAVVERVTHVEALDRLYQTPTTSADLVRCRNYIEQPKPDGYRGIHYVFRYNSTTETYQHYDGFQIEIQIRSKLQHMWSTANETVSTFTSQRLKQGIGSVSWLRFFALMSNVIAIREARPRVPGVPDTGTELRRELSSLAKELNVEDSLLHWQALMSHPVSRVSKDARLFLLVLDTRKSILNVTSFSDRESALASERYRQAELEVEAEPWKDAVLVVGDSVEALRKGYPNYYVDMTAFIITLRAAIKEPV